MERVKIFTDSCSDLPDDVLKKYNIEMLATPVHFGDKVYGDRKELSPIEFYKKLDESPELPKTSMITPDTFIKKFKKALSEGYKVLSINFSSELSGIYESAVIAKRNIASDDIHIIDSKSASVGLGLSVYLAARALKEGKKLKEVIKLTKYNCSHMEHIFAVGSLNMLKKGGRISKGEALIGSVLNIKPILHFQNGKILPYSKTRGKKKMLEFLLKTMEERGYNFREQIIGINYSGDPELAEEVKHMIKDKYGIEDYLISEIGAAIGAHVGRNTVSVFFLNKEQVANVTVI